MTDSILQSTKKILGLAPDYDAFDLDIMTHINSVFLTINDLGVGPSGGFFITGQDETWGDFLGGDPAVNRIKPYVYLKVRLLFDPPTSSFHLESLKEQAKEFEWRISVIRESALTVSDLPSDGVIDGGAP